MSSLAATQADGYYIPPAYLESGAYKKKSLNQYNNSKGHNQYLTRSVCRFELPFDGFCTLCDAIVGKGTRFNAHKSHVGDYYTTKIYEFVTKCRSCGECEFRMRTNPSDRTFDYVGGIRRKVEEFDTADAGTHGVIDTEFGNGILRYENGRVEGPGVEDARHDAAMAASSSTTTTTTSSSSSMLRLLERDVVDHRTSQTEHGRMSTLLRINSRMIDDACANASIRKSFREDRRAKRRRFERASDLGLGKGIELLDDDDDDDGGGGGGGGGGRGGGGRGGTTTRGEEDAIAARSAMDSRRRTEGASRARASERMRFGNARAGGIFGSTRPPGGGGLRGSGGGGTTAATTVRNDPGKCNEKLVERKRRGSAHAGGGGGGGGGVVVLRKSGPKRMNTAENNGHDRKHNRPPSPLGETIVDGKSSHASGGGALALLSSCYASDSDSND